jgi:hypothetical protein
MFQAVYRPSSGAQTVHTASGMCQLTHATVAASKLDTYQMLCVQFELLMMGGKTACNMQSIDSNKEYCITLHLVG